MTTTPTTSKTKSRPVQSGKKYYSISEVCKMLDLKPYQIRYAEKANTIKIHKVNNRRYYTQKEITKLKEVMGLKSNSNDTETVQKINQLIDKLASLCVMTSKPL